MKSSCLGREDEFYNKRIKIIGRLSLIPIVAIFNILTFSLLPIGALVIISLVCSVILFFIIDLIGEEVYRKTSTDDLFMKLSKKYKVIEENEEAFYIVFKKNFQWYYVANYEFSKFKKYFTNPTDAKIWYKKQFIKTSNKVENLKVVYEGRIGRENTF